MKIDEVKLMFTELSDKEIRAIQFFIRNNNLIFRLTEFSDHNYYLGFDTTEYREKERVLITFDDFVEMFNVDVNPEVEYDVYTVLTDDGCLTQVVKEI